jgi:predicted protein tyrosine phosphatase
MFHVEILSGLWIADTDVLKSTKFIEDNQITILINCTQLFEFPSCQNLQKVRIPFSPNQSSGDNMNLLRENHVKIVDFILENLDSHNILITCYDGKCISPMIVALLISRGSKFKKHSIYEVLLQHNKDFSLWCDLSTFQ